MNCQRVIKQMTDRLSIVSGGGGFTIIKITQKRKETAAVRIF